MTWRSAFKKIYVRIAALLMTLLSVFTFLLPAPTIAHAETAEILAFDSTDVDEDLDGEDLSAYPYNPLATTKITVYSFIEYAFSDTASKCDNYALYVYVYNPTKMDFVTLTGASSVNIATAYNRDANGELVKNTTTGHYAPSTYSNLDLKYCGTTDNELFVKFRVMDVTDVLKNVQAMDKNGGVRQYDLASIQLYEKGASNAVDYKITADADYDRGGRTYFYSGYAKGLGKGALSEATLAVEYQDLASVDLTITHTSYKVGITEKYHQNELHSVYFSVDERLIEDFGRLRKILAEWYEYKMTPTIVAESEIYNKLKPYVGVDIGVGDDEYANNDLPYRIHQAIEIITGEYYYYGYSWNENLKDSIGTGINTFYESDYIEKVLKLLFEVPSTFPDVNKYTVKGEDVLQAAFDYKGKTADSGKTLPIKDGTIPADCFLETVDEGRTAGYNKREFDADNVDDQWDLLGYYDNNSWWDAFMDYGFVKPDEIDDSLKDVAPIKEVTAAEMEQTDDAVLASTLYINENDVKAFREFFEKETKAGKKVYLFRFAATDYFAAPLTVKDLETNETVSTESDPSAEVRQGTAFLQFDILTLTFDKDGELTVLGVACSPIDALGDYTPAILDPPDFDKDWWKKIVALIVIILIIIAAIKVISWARREFVTGKTYSYAKKAAKGSSNKKRRR